MFRLACALDLAHVPFNGAAPAIASTITGHTQIAFMSLAAAAPTIGSGKLRALAITSSRRSVLFPGIPTMAEAGVPDQESSFWQGLVFPSGTPAKRWHGGVVEVLGRTEVRDRLTAMSLEIVANTPESSVRISSRRLQNGAASSRRPRSASLTAERCGRTVQGTCDATL
jgi:tripartite-type tricarboxylate transporter receptor subunit TctC